MLISNIRCKLWYRWAQRLGVPKTTERLLSRKTQLRYISKKFLSGKWKKSPVICLLLEGLSTARPWFQISQKTVVSCLEYFVIGSGLRGIHRSGWESLRGNESRMLWSSTATYYVISPSHLFSSRQTALLWNSLLFPTQRINRQLEFN